MLEELRQLDIDALELTRPFRQFAATLAAIGSQLNSIAFAATINPDVRRSTENLLDEMDHAARLVETAARSAFHSNVQLASAGVRSWFAEALALPELREALTDNDVMTGTEPTAAEAAQQVDAEIAEIAAAVKRGDITLNLPAVVAENLASTEQAISEAETARKAPAMPAHAELAGCMCDWGACDHDAVAFRWSPEHGWLPVCDDCRTGDPKKSAKS
jgi:hypothetical protein